MVKVLIRLINSKTLNEKVLNKFLKKRLSNGIKVNSAGRSNSGKITVRHKGCQIKRLIRVLNFKFFFWNVYGIIIKVCYDPNRTAPIVLNCYTNGIVSYQIASTNAKIGGLVFIGEVNFKEKNLSMFTSFINNFNEGSLVNNIEIHKFKGSQCIRSAGCSGQVLKKKEGTVLVRLPSKEERIFSANSIATLGQIANVKHFLLKISKAGRNRLLGIRPTVRGVAMNPIDHPHGGGQGKTSGAGGYRSQVTFKSKVAKTQPTRNKRKNSIYIKKFRLRS
jgi:large subunit ribosomal protein L2